MKSSDLLKSLPSVNELLENPQVKSVVDRLNKSTVSTRVRSFLDELREEVTHRAEGLPLPSLREVVDRVTRYVSRDEGWKLKGAVNATGRFRGGQWASTPLGDAAVERVLLLSKDYATVGDSASHCGDAEGELTRLTGAQAAAVFPSHASAYAMLLDALVEGHPVVVSRGELGEIDPGCRLTDLCSRVGAQVREVGATDSVTQADYAAALSDQDSVVLRRAVESYRIVGGAPRPSTAEVAQLKHSGNSVLIEDLGAGPLVDLPMIEGVCSPSAVSALADGADLVMLRGDGILGGPECSIVLGKRELIDRLLQHPMAAAHRPSALTCAALAASVKLLEDPEQAVLSNPLLTLLSAPVENLRQRAERIAIQLSEAAGIERVEVVEATAESAVAGGLPYAAPSVAVALTPTEGSAGELAETFASSTPAVWGRVEGARLLLDLRTVFPRQDMTLVSTLPAAETPANSEPEGQSGD